jgi:hypothetical protein
LYTWPVAVVMAAVMIGTPAGVDQQSQTRIRLGLTRLDGTEGTRIWTGQGVFAHNLVKIGALAS